MTTIKQLFQTQIDQTTPITAEQIEQTKRLRKDAGISDEEIKKFLDGVIPGKSKMLFYVLEQKQNPSDDFMRRPVSIKIVSCWDHQVDEIAATHKLNNDGVAHSPGSGATFPRLSRSVDLVLGFVYN